jgi:macrolide transport system ATP-binding/permease protein
MNSFFRKLTWLRQRRQKEDDLRDELQFHLDQESEELHSQGLSTDQAQHAARRDLGNLALVKEDTRATWSWTFLEQLAQDLRYAARTMGNNKAFTALAALSLALGIGANTAIYSFLDALLLRSLPVADPGSLVVLRWHSKPGARRTGDFVMEGMHGSVYDDPSGSVSDLFPFPAFPFFQKAGTSVFSDVFTYCHTREVRTLNLTIKGQAEVATGELVSGGYFHGLRVAPAAGRLIFSDDDRFGAAPIAVVSHALAEKRLGGANNAPGQSILIDNLPFTIVGVAPPEFFGIDADQVPDVYLPMHTNVLLGAADSFGATAGGYLEQNDYWIQVMARLRPGVTLDQAQAAMAGPFQLWIATTAKNDKQRANLPTLAVEPGATGLDTLRRQFSKPLYVLMTLVGLILAIACSNVANLLLARAASRRREIALRISLGAGRLRVIRQLLTESVLLASIGGVLGVFVALLSIRFLTVLLASGSRHVTIAAELNWHVLAVAAALSLLTGLLFGLAPALQATGLDLIPALKETRANQLRHRGRVNVSQMLIVGQIAVALLMLVAAGLFVRTLSNLESVELGYNRENVLLFQVDARKAGHRDPEISSFYGDLRQHLATVPGVRRATLAATSLIGASDYLAITLPGGRPADGIPMLSVGPGFLTTMQIPLLAGRDFDDRDHAGSQPVAIINQRYARNTFGDQNPLGRHLILWKREQPAREMEIVGVAKDARYGGLKREILPVVYIPYDQGYPPPQEMVFALRTAGDPLSYVKSVREAVHQADPRVPVSDVRTETAEINEDMSQETTLASLCTAFALLALAIACVGLYGTMSYTVARRTGEIGIRMALGAQRRTVVWMVLREVALLSLIGLALSIPAALIASKFVESFLFGTKPNDPLSLAIAVTILLSAALLAGYVPARRASRIDPMIALRHE